MANKNKNQNSLISFSDDGALRNYIIIKNKTALENFMIYYSINKDQLESYYESVWKQSEKTEGDFVGKYDDISTQYKKDGK